VRATAIILSLACAGALPASAQDPTAGADVLKHLTGTWRAPEERTPLGTPLDEQVFGVGAMNVRTVTLAISPAGDADLQIRRSVVGAKGKVFAPSVTEVKMKIAGPVTMTPGHLEPKVTVASAEDRYLDGGHERFTRDGVRVNISLYSPTSTELNLQYEASDGRDGFGATLTSAAAGTGRRARPPVS
jgi:hypothetical protein